MYRAALIDLQAVIAVVRRGSFRAAAIDLGLSSTAFSHTIAKLEAGLGVRLFNRTTRSVSLTDAGRTFVRQIAPALQDIGDAMEAVRAQRQTPSGLLRINAAITAAREILSPLLLEFLARYPDMEIDLVTEGRLVDIVADGFDLGVRTANLVPSDMIAVSLGWPQRYAVVGSPAYFATRPIPQTPADLYAHRCARVRLPNGALFRWQFEKQGESLQVDVRGPITLDEGTLSRQVALSGLGLIYIHEYSVLPDIDAGRLIRVLEDWTLPLPGLCIYYPGRRNLSAGMRAFIALVRELAAMPSLHEDNKRAGSA
ncbi:lysR substrate binding domain protein [Ochrobactrum quorumnocens]|uniref:LysR substrate binding domain protein n=1 Tax=Ochrobactrum quorumnocens TaxID=271865 RepID=A0A248UBL8_9HYPH|nr:LysR family transcriptional regulator [[Ochrobactrum] quorumnocens]ASV84084.1 lysR substrate binding domain protein [[Ochrobactrum] quorumnocens]